MSFTKETGLTYQDVALVPQYNNVASRTEPNLATWLTQRTPIAHPLIPANMDTVISPEMARVLRDNGSYPIFHRFAPLADQLAWVKEFPQACYISAGFNQLPNVLELLDAGARGVCIDVAHGHSKTMLEYIQQIKHERPNAEVIAGNVCTAIAYQDLVNAGADAVKVGVGPGSNCTTRIMTGFGVPQFTAVYECAQLAKKLRVPIIADGGIREPRDVAIALAAGASTVMMGGLFARTYESAAPKTTHPDGTTTARFRGQASKEFQEDFYGKMRPKTVPEGIGQTVQVKQSTQEVLDSFLGGLRSAMTYGGARDMKEFQRKAEFIRVSSGYMKESYPQQM